VEFEWDEEKSGRTKQQRGLSFSDAVHIWYDSDAIEISVRAETEVRWAKIGKLSGQIHTAIFTLRGTKIRIISVRRSHPKEIAFYGQNQKEDFS
jgi:uncharacterized protein